MREHAIGCLIVTNDSGDLEGVLSERDLLNRAALESDEGEERTVGDVMTRSPETVHEADPVAYALQRMMVGDYRHLPVLDEGGSPVGVTSSRDVLHYIERIIDAARNRTTG